MYGLPPSRGNLKSGPQGPYSLLLFRKKTKSEYDIVYGFFLMTNGGIILIESKLN
jgi:hypothetical protein